MADRSGVVVGGGLAGIAAALRLADAGWSVTLLEGRPRLGGAAFSFRRDELWIDNGQHVFLRCCTAYRALVDRLGATSLTHLQDRLDIPVLQGGGRVARLTRTPHVPAPAHLGAALARYSALGVPDRLRAVRGALALRRLNPAVAQLDSCSLGTFLRQHGQTGAVIDALWGIVATATLNLPPDEASLALAAKVFRTGLLDNAAAADIGWAAAPLGELHGTAAAAALDRAGVEVALGERVDRVHPGGLVSSRRGDRVRTLQADAVVVALPHREAFAAVPELAETPSAPARALGASPIVNVHVLYDRRVTDLPFAAAVGSPVQWVFDRTETSGLTRQHPGAQYLAVTVSAADDVVGVPSRQLQDRFVAELARLFPATARASVLEAFVTREKRATFRQAVGSNALRPGAETPLEAIFLAGAWTATGWPDTMESAVRSGLTAADAATGRPVAPALGFAS
jgi:squalene-associated FAD-dependent desaturase